MTTMRNTGSEWGTSHYNGELLQVQDAAHSNRRLGSVWMAGRLKAGDLLVVKDHSGDHFHDYSLIEQTADGKYVGRIVPRVAGYGGSGVNVGKIEERAYFDAMAGMPQALDVPPVNAKLTTTFEKTAVERRARRGDIYKVADVDVASRNAKDTWMEGRFKRGDVLLCLGLDAQGNNRWASLENGANFIKLVKETEFACKSLVGGKVGALTENQVAQLEANPDTPFASTGLSARAKNVPNHHHGGARPF